MGLLFAEQVSAEHRSSARVLLAGPLFRRALYNPNFKASVRCSALPPSMPLISSRTEFVVLSVLSFVPRFFHPITMISGFLLIRFGMGLNIQELDSIRTELQNSKKSQPQCFLE